MLTDLLYAARTLRKSPGFAMVAIIALAIGIGANTAIFSVVDAVLLRSLPYRDAGQLAMVWQSVPKLGYSQIPVSQADFADFQEQNRVFEQISAIYLDKSDYNFTGHGEPERLRGVAVSANLFSTLGVQPAMGRAFLAREDQKGREQVAIVSHGFWQRRFGADPNLLGKTVTLDGKPYTVAGVMPRGFRFPPPMTMSLNALPADCEIWVPAVLDRSNRDYHPLGAVARLKPGVTLAQARAAMETIARRLEQEHPKTNSGMGGAVALMNEQVVQSVRPALLLLLGAVGLVLLIACANVANLLLARAAGRQREMAIRIALGAGRSRVIRQVLTESVLLALMGGVAGALLALWGVDLLRSFDEVAIPRIAEAQVDLRVLGFTLLVSLLTGLFFGLAPAWQGSKPHLNEFLKQGSRTVVGGARGRLRSVLVIGEVALALMLLVGAGLLIRSFTRLLDVRPGFNTHNLLAMTIRLPEFKYPEDRNKAAFYTQLLERVNRLPGVKSSGLVNSPPFEGFQGATLIFVEGRPAPASMADTPMGNYRVASSDYLRTMGIPVLQGRFFTGRDNRDAPEIVAISAAMAHRLFPGENPIGKRIKLNDQNSPWRTVVGVVGDIRDAGLDRDYEMAFYRPLLQDTWEIATLMVRTTGDPAGLASAVRRQVWDLDKEQPVFNVKSMDRMLSGSVASRRFLMLLLGLFSFIALLLASLGIYGVISYSVTQRTHEMGLRMALGARRSEVLRLVAGQGLRLCLTGVVLGLTGAVAATRLMSGMLYGVRPTDMVTLVAAPLVLMAVALVACYFPARRATRVDPMVALRYE